MPLDPIVSLTVAIAEAPGSYACLLGSGVSRDAGVPTGTDVLWLAVGELYRLEHKTEETPQRDALAAWLRETDRADLGYSDVLELLTPDAATRREYLAKHFAGVEPAATHKRLAELAVRGLVRVFITTNFDRLLERALQARGIDPIVVTSDADLSAAPRREHADCFVLKGHGDYLQQTIRNTPAELAELEPGIARELQEILDRYGIVVLGYSGGDEAIANAVRGRRSRYGLYWLARGEVAEPGRSLVEAVGGRVIARPDAAEFLTDLEQRLAVFESHPSGLTPITVNDEVLALLSRGERVALSELLRRERHEFEQRYGEVSERRRKEQATYGAAADAHDELLPLLERRLASLLPLVLHDERLFEEEVNALADYKSAQPLLGGISIWLGLLDWCLWWLTCFLGAFAVRMRRVENLRPMFDAQATTRNEGVEPLAKSFAGDSGPTIGQGVMARISDQKWLDPAWESLLRDAEALGLFEERYPELVSSEHERQRAFAEYDFLLNIALGMREQRVVAHWSMYSEMANGFARRLRADARLRASAARAVGLSLEEFDEKAPSMLDAAFKLVPFPDTSAIRILERGGGLQ
jgi:hypothetical protein